MGLAKDYAQVEVNSSVAGRKGTYFRSEVSVSNDSRAEYQSIDAEVSCGGQQSTESGSTFVPKTSEIFTYDANGNLTSDGRWNYTWDVENRLIKMATKSGVAVTIKKKGNSPRKYTKQPDMPMILGCFPRCWHERYGSNTQGLITT